MRRLIAASAATATALGLALVAAPAGATITTPSNGATVGGILTMNETGATDGSACISGSAPQTQVRLFNSANTAVFNQTKSGTGAALYTVDTHTLPNGAYKVQTDIRNRTGTLFCGNNTVTNTANITIQNTVAFTYTGPTSAPQNTTVPLSFTLTDPNNANAPLSGFTLSVALTGGGSVTGTSNAQGQISVNLPIAGPPRSGATLSVTYAGTSFWAAKTINVPFDVQKNASTATLAQPGPVVHGQPTSFTATVAAVTGSSTPTGTVQFKVDGQDFGSPVDVGSGTVTSQPTDSLSTGSHTVVAVYSGDSNISGQTSASRTQVVGKADVLTTLTRSPNGGTVSGQAVTFTAQVAAQAPGAGNPTGGVQFNVDGQPFGTAVALSGDTASLTVSNLQPGNHDVVAVYNGSADFNTSSSAPLTHGVNKANTSLALTSSDPAAVSGQPLTYTAVVAPVAPGAGTPTGQVQFTVDGDALGAPVNLVGGQATSPVTNLKVYSHQIAANYLGDSRFGGSNKSLTQAIAPAHTTTALTTSPNPSVFGQAVTLHAEVIPDAPATGGPEGTIRFRIDGGVNNGGQDLYVDTVGGAATASISSLSVGSHSVVATYLSGDLNFTTSSDSDTQVVNKAATKTVLSSNVPTSVFGQPVTFTAAVSVLAPGAGAPTGEVVFTDGSTVLATVPLSSAYQATFTTDDLAVGQHAITATYSGDGSFQTSNGSAAQTVKKAQTTTVVTSSNNPALTGQGATFTAVVAPVAPGAGVPTGTVQFTVNGLPVGGARTLVDGSATSTSFIGLTPGTYKVKAVYSGETRFAGSSGLLDQGMGQTVNQAATSLSLSTDAATPAYNAPVTFTATVSAVAPATGKPSGVVRFWEGDVLLGSNSLTPASSGNTATAEFVSSTLTPNGHTVRAEYVGNFNFAGAEGQTSVSVGRVPTVTGVSSSANPVTFGSPVTLKATVSESLPAQGEPTGSVTFKEGSTVLGTGTISTVGGEQVATATVSGLTGGAHAITAVYSGDTVFANSTSASFTQNVSQQATKILPGLPSYVAGEGIPAKNGYVRAKLVDASGAPLAGRTITFTNKPTATRPAYVLCTAVTGADGIAECNTTAINIDPSHTGEDILIDVNGAYDATFSGSAGYASSTGRGQTF